MVGSGEIADVPGEEGKITRPYASCRRCRCGLEVVDRYM